MGENDLYNFSSMNSYGLNPNRFMPNLGNYGTTSNLSPTYGLDGASFGSSLGSSLGSLDTGVSSAIANVNKPLSLWDSLKQIGSGAVGTTQNPGWGGLALGAANSLGNMFMGMQQYGLAKQQLAEGKRQFQANYDAQKQMTNSQLEDRQRSRIASNPGAYQSVGDYMKNYGIR